MYISLAYGEAVVDTDDLQKALAITADTADQFFVEDDNSVNDDDYMDEESPSDTELFTEEEQTASLQALPTIDYFEKKYGRSMQNDQKAAKVFRDYESVEKLRRLQNELVYVKEQRVGERTCRFIIGPKRSGKHGSYSRWAQLMLLWLVQKGR